MIRPPGGASNAGRYEVAVWDAKTQDKPREIPEPHVIVALLVVEAPAAAALPDMKAGGIRLGKVEGGEWLARQTLRVTHEQDFYTFDCPCSGDVTVRSWLGADGGAVKVATFPV